jgi:hypothetical protein
MSKPKGTKIILSGTEADRFAETAYQFAGCRDMLVSFLYAEKKGSKWFEDRAKKYPGVKLFIDSGAHTFRKDGYTEAWPDLAWFDDYVQRYRDWIIKNRDYIELVVNLDIDNVCGFSEMVRWDNEVFRPLERLGIPVCYVWHESYGFDHWMKMCREHEYVGLPGHLSEADFYKMLKPAMANGCRVHGFAATKSYVLGRIPLATVDSTSWKAGEMYGQTFVFENSKLKVIDKNQKAERIKYKAQWVAAGVDWPLLEKDQASEITKVCAIAWGDYQKYVTQMTEKLAYWNKTSVLVDNFINENGGSIRNIPKESISKFFSEHKVTVNASSDATAREDLSEIRGFLARDPEIVFALSDERLEDWIKRLGATPENESRAEKEAAVRQRLYETLYKIGGVEPFPRMTEDLVEPVKKLLDREEELREYPSVEVPLPGEDGLYEAGSLLALTSETTQGQPSTGVTTAQGFTDSRLEGLPPEVNLDPSKVLPDKGFTSTLSDNLLKVRAGYGVELLFEQFKLRHESSVLKILKRQPRKQKELLSKASALAEEVSKIAQAIGETAAEAMRASAEDAFETWKTLNNPDTAKKMLEEKKKTLTAQAQRFIENPELARQIGKLGGAPKGNQNARKHGVYSTKMPQLACDNCPHTQVCPQYRAGHVCAYLNELSDTKNMSDRDKELADLEALQQTTLIRLRRAMMFETFQGGVLDKEVTKLTASAANITKLIHMVKHPPAQPFRPMAPQTGNEGHGAPKESILQGLFKDLIKKPDGTFAASDDKAGAT